MFCLSLTLLRRFSLSHIPRSSQMGITPALDIVNMIHNSASESPGHKNMTMTLYEEQVWESGSYIHWLLINFACLRKTPYTASAQKERQAEPGCVIAGLYVNPARVALSVAWPGAAQKQKSKIEFLLPEAVHHWSACKPAKGMTWSSESYQGGGEN